MHLDHSQSQDFVLLKLDQKHKVVSWWHQTKRSEYYKVV